MDKKLLVSVMMTAPLAAFAADVTGWNTDNGSLRYSILPQIDKDNWVPNGTTGDAVADDNGVLTLPVSTGYLSGNMLLPLGTYNFAWTAENAIVEINNKYMVETNAAGQYVDAAGKVTSDITKMIPLSSKSLPYKSQTTVAIKIIPIVKDLTFSIGSFSATLTGVNFATIQSNLQSRLNAISLSNVYDDDTRAEAKALREQLKSLKAERASIQSMIDAIKLGDANALATAYTTYRLDLWNATATKATDNISKKIAAFNTSATAYNTAVANENLAWDNIQLNTANKAKYLNEVSALQTLLNNKEAEITNLTTTNPQSAELAEYIKWVTSKDTAAAQTAITDFENAIKAAYADLTKTVATDKFDTTNTAIEGQINAISYQGAIDDWNAYGQFEIAKTGLMDVYTKYFTYINSVNVPLNPVYNAAEATADQKGNVYYDKVGDALKTIANILNAAYEINPAGGQKPNNPNIAGAAEKLQRVLDNIQERKDDIIAAYQTLKNLQTSQDAKWGTATSEIAGYVTDLTAKQDVAKNPAFSKLSAADQKTYNDAVTAIANALTALKNEAQKEYLAHGLDVNGTDYQAAVQAYKDAVAAYNTAIAPFQSVIGVLIDFINVKAYVHDKCLTVGAEYAAALEAKFTTAFNNIDEAIAKYYKNQTDGKTDIDNGIQNVKNACDTLVGAFTNVLGEITAAQNALDAFNQVVKNKTVVSCYNPATQKEEAAYNKSTYSFDVDEDKYGVASVTAASIQTDIDNYKKDLKAIANGTGTLDNPQLAYQAAVDLKAEVDREAYSSLIPNEMTPNFNEKVTKANLDAVQTLDNYITGKKYTAPYSTAVGMDKVDISLVLPKDYPANRAQNANQAAYNVLVAGSNAAKLADCDADLVVLANAYGVVYEELVKVVNNYDAYQDMLDAASISQNIITELQTKLWNLTNDPASSYYNTLINGSEYQGKLNGYNTAISNSYTAMTAVADKNTMLDNLTQLNSNIGDLEKAIKANQVAFNAVSVKGDEVANTINQLIAWLTANDGVVANRDKFLADVQDITDQLANYNVGITKEFGKGNSVDTKDGYMLEAQDMLDALAQIQADEDAGYKAAVEKNNADYLATLGLGANALDKQYTDAINEVNRYRYDITNPGYYKFLMGNKTIQDNHEHLQNCYKDIQNLNVDLSAFVQQLTQTFSRKGYIVLPSSDPEVVAALADLEAEGKRISDDIANTLATINTTAEQLAKEYYGGYTDPVDGTVVEGLHEKAENLYDAIKDRLISAGLTEDEVVKGQVVLGEVGKALEPLTKLLTPAEKSYDSCQSHITAGEEGAVPDFIVEMSQICDQLDAMLKAVKDLESTDKDGNVTSGEDNYVYNAIEAQWTSKYDWTVETLDGLYKELTGDPDDDKDTGYSEDPNFDTAVSQFQALQTSLTELDEEWDEFNNAEKESNYDEFANENTDHTNLDGIYDAALKIVKDAESAHNLAVANNAALKELLTNYPADTENPNSAQSATQTKLDNLLAWSGYHDDQLATIASLQAKINNLVATILANKATAKDDLAGNKTLFNNIQKNIANAYQTVFDEEKIYAQTLMVKLRSAFNNAKLIADNADLLDGWDADIKSLQAKLDACKYPTGTAYSEANRDAARKTLLSLEDQIAALNELIEEAGKSATVDTDTLDEVLAALNKQYNTINGELADDLSQIDTLGDASGTYGAGVKAVYGPKIQALIDELNSLYYAYSNFNRTYLHDSDVVPDQDEYAYKMAQLEKKIAPIMKAWEPAQTEATKFYVSDCRYDALKAALDAELPVIQYAVTQASLYNVKYDNAAYYAIQSYLYDQYGRTGALVSEGEYTKLLKQKNAHSLTAASNLPLFSNGEDYATYVNTYMRTMLYNVAKAYETEAMNAADALQAELENAVINGNKVEYLNWPEIEAAITGAWTEADNLDYSNNPDGNNGIKWLKYNAKNNTWGTATDFEQAKTRYEAIIDVVNGIFDTLDSIKDKAEENKYIKGDLDDDQKLTVLDIQKLIAEVGDEKTFEGTDQAARDINDDDVLNMADITALINMVYKQEQPANAPMRLRQYLPAVSGSNSINAIEVQGENGLRRFAVVLDNEVSFAGLQLDIFGADVVGVSCADRASELDAYLFDNGDHSRVIITSLQNDLIQGNNGAVLFIDIEGNGEVDLQNVVASDINGNAYYLGKSASNGASMIESIKDGVKAIYNAAGQKLNSLTKGINIVRNADGSVTKKIGK